MEPICVLRRRVHGRRPPPLGGSGPQRSAMGLPDGTRMAPSHACSGPACRTPSGAPQHRGSAALPSRLRAATTIRSRRHRSDAYPRRGRSGDSRAWRVANGVQGGADRSEPGAHWGGVEELGGRRRAGRPCSARIAARRRRNGGLCAMWRVAVVAGAPMAAIADDASWLLIVPTSSLDLWDIMEAATDIRTFAPVTARIAAESAGRPAQWQPVCRRPEVCIVCRARERRRHPGGRPGRKGPAPRGPRHAGPRLRDRDPVAAGPGPVRCGAVRPGAVSCGAVRCGANGPATEAGRESPAATGASISRGSAGSPCLVAGRQRCSATDPVALAGGAEALPARGTGHHQGALLEGEPVACADEHRPVEFDVEVGAQPELADEEGAGCGGDSVGMNSHGSSMAHGAVPRRGAGPVGSWPPPGPRSAPLPVGEGRRVRPGPLESDP